MTRNQPRRPLSAYVLVGFGAILLVSGTLTTGQAASRGAWGTVLITGLLMLLIGFGMVRGLRQLRPPADPDGDEDAPES